MLADRAGAAGKDRRIRDATPPAMRRAGRSPPPVRITLRQRCARCACYVGRRRCCRCGSHRLDGLRHVCGSIAAAGPLRCAAEQSPTLCAHVAPARCCPCWPWACCRVAPVWLLRRGPDCRPSRSPPASAPRARRPPGSCPPAARVAAAVIQRGPLSRYACYDCNNYIDLHYILYLQYCTIWYNY